MYNTTTIPTSEELSIPFLRLFSILSVGMVVAGSVIELFLYRLREKERAYQYDSSEEETESDEEEEEEEEEDYCEKYQEEFAALPSHKLSEEALTQLNTKIVREQIAENVEVIMTFDKATDTFWYYTDHLKDVSYPILETVARKFAIENNCRSICLQAEQQVQTEKQTEQQAEQQAEQPAEQQVQAPIPSVFAKFKNYNSGKGTAPNFTSVLKVTEQMNHFRYRGKRIDYEERAKTKERVEEPTLDYASYKKLLEEKKKN
jgi:hypothetical protein